ncbi:tRNA (guanine-N(7)-)-methyltransferase non-catalytic subunit wdr4-like [Micractinium conductrix]|uniref:tRNA (guanine-N(7)-)-methyltransferase non-catalytic subunit n=1 Tax=Micractinium conductrix TaxID=554055 RepID=A0A2P6VJL2_9CHLO|nr:tRNA (guanine-N(7)-)-methyltransferase non-catalytic subunit wdr4-like [Micractinium conductrix]|eukprot:PSC74264.1 tRNA (guanine-N(7)-)-methyltransferase non-catalytic subunit wdr4-like [Micractinium conductrix]
MGKGKRKTAAAKAAAAEKTGEQGAVPAQGGNQHEWAQPTDPPRAVLAVHPAGAALALAVGPELRVFDARTGEHHVLISKADARAQGPQDPGHAARGSVPFVRGVAFDAQGRYLLAGSEDKADGLRLWDATTWKLLQSIKVPKKVTATAFTADGSYLLASDKFGDIIAAATQRPEGLPAGQQQEPEILLGHYCAILTSLSLSAGGCLLATTDRDSRVRVSIVPADPLAGAHEVQTLCFGHTTFVTCSTFVQNGEQHHLLQHHLLQELLVTGSGDGTLRLWDPLQGTLLHTLELPRPQQPEGQQQEQQRDGGAAAEVAEAAEAEAAEAEAAEAEAEAGAEAAAGGEEAEEGCGLQGGAPLDAPVPLALAASPDGRWLVAAVDGEDELCVVSLDWDARQLALTSRAALPGLHLPACLCFDAEARLWTAGGPVADDSTAAFLACGRVAEGGVLEGAAPPGWLPAAAAAALEAKTGGEEAALAAAAERRRLASQQLQKRKYSLQQLENRKRTRRDKVAKAADQAAAPAAGAGDGQ